MPLPNGDKTTAIAVFDKMPFRSFEFDALLNEVSTITRTVTEHPVEDGSVIADHIREEPVEIQLDGVVSNTPVIALASVFQSSSRAEDCYDGLLELLDAKDTCTVYTPVRDYEDMVLTKVARTRNAGVGEAVQVSITLRQIRKVEATTVAAPVRAGRKPNKKLGKAATSTTQNASALSKLAGWVGI